VVFAEAVQEGINSTCPHISDAVVLYLQKNASIRHDQYATNPEALHNDLKKIFGYGAKGIEKKILEFLYLKLENPKNIKSDFKFAEEVKEAQKFLDYPSLPITERIEQTKKYGNQLVRH
jgi:hypothetical protein